VNDIAVGLKQGRGTAGMLLRDDAVAKQVRQTITTASSGVDEIVADLKAGRGPAGMLLKDEALSGQIRDSVNNLHQTTADLGHASHQVDALVSDLSSRNIPQKVDDIADNVNDITHQFRQVISEASEPDRQGMTAGANIRESLMNANAATANLADGTEALKHNFLVRGFFRTRGYYNLDHISPERYRQDKIFTSPSNYRAWLSASNLFQEDRNGREELSAPGKALLDGALTEYGDAVVDSPIVVEGYCSTAGSRDQLWLSRNRAILVRQYLQSHLQLEPSNIGIVAMKSSPPKGTAQTTWDGVCILVLRKKSQSAD
jgi:phospholipid/cholesterol/gamma-HCH transport system substrate-binding protein